MPIFIRSISDQTSEVVNYNGKQLPRDKVTYTPAAPDLTNNPSRTLIAGIQLPQDTAIYITGEKLLAMSQILDGVVVYERILRKPYEIEFEFVLRTPDPNINGEYIFPQEDILNIWTNIWLPNTVLKIENTYLNKLGIQEFVIHEIAPVTIRGSKNLPVRFRGFENVPGLSLIIN